MAKPVAALELTVLLADLEARRREIEASGSNEVQTFGLLFGTFAVIIGAIVTAKVGDVSSGFKDALPSGFLAISLLSMWFPINNAHQWLQTRTAARYATRVVAPRIRDVIYGEKSTASTLLAKRSLLSWEEYLERHVYSLTLMNAVAFPIGIFRTAILYVPAATALGYYQFASAHLATPAWVWIEILLAVTAWLTLFYPAVLTILLQLIPNGRIAPTDG